MFLLEPKRNTGGAIADLFLQMLVAWLSLVPIVSKILTWNKRGLERQNEASYPNLDLCAPESMEVAHQPGC